MTLLGTCSSCHKRKLLVKKRTYKHPKISAPMTSDGELCGPCFKRIISSVS